MAVSPHTARSSVHMCLTLTQNNVIISYRRLRGLTTIFLNVLGPVFRLVPLHCPKTSQLVKPRQSMIDPMASTSGYFPDHKLYAGGLPPPGGLSPLPGDLTRLDDYMN